MILVVLLAAAAVMCVAIGAKGLTGQGVQLTRTKTIGGPAGKTMAVVCLVFGALFAVAALGCLVFLMRRFLA